MSDDNTNQLSAEQANLLKGAEGLLQDPETRSGFFSLLKKKNPEMSIPELDVSNSLQEALRKEREEREKLEARIKENETKQEIKERRAHLMKNGISESDIPEIEKIMTEKGIMSHETAAEFYRNSKKLAGGGTNEASKPKNTLANPFDEANEKFGGNIRSWARNEALSLWKGAAK